MAVRGLDVRQVDNSIDRPSVASDRFPFTRATVGGPRRNSVAQLVTDAGLDPDRTILKIDIESAQWDLLATAPDTLLARFPQIINEFHGLSTDNLFLNVADRMNCLNRRNAHHCVIHAHGNNHERVRLVGSLAIPEVLEVTYGSRGRYAFETSDETFPTAPRRHERTGSTGD